MHQGDADYGYLPSVVEIFFINYLLGNSAPAKERDGEGGLLKTPFIHTLVYVFLISIVSVFLLGAIFQSLDEANVVKKDVEKQLIGRIVNEFPATMPS